MPGGKVKHEIDINRYAHWEPLETKTGLVGPRVLSSRGIELIYEPFKDYDTQVAVEDHCKWYQLFLLRKNSRGLLIGDLQYFEIEEALLASKDPHIGRRDGRCVQGDHCVNPDALVDFCRLSGVHLSNRVLYMVQGMWWENHL